MQYPSHLKPGSGIAWETPISFLIERTPFASSYGDACLDAAGGYSIDLKFWWHIKFPLEVVFRTLKYLPDNKSGKLISINVLEFVVVIIDYCAALTYSNTDRRRDRRSPSRFVEYSRQYSSSYLDNAYLQIFKIGKASSKIILFHHHGTKQ